MQAKYNGPLSQSANAFTKFLRPEDALKPVESIIVFGSRDPDPTDGPPNYFHWVLHLLLGDGGYVVLNMIPGANANKGVLMITSETNPQPPTPITFSYPIPLSKSVSVNEVLLFYQERKFDQYQFTGEGTGCYCWALATLQALAEFGVVPKDAPRELDTWFHQRKAENAGRILGVKGSFY